MSCAHLNISIGEMETEDGVHYFPYTCKDCGALKVYEVLQDGLTLGGYWRTQVDQRNCSANRESES